ncbi:hypothetical protein ACQ4PT_060817 [Festuca glaucescens]
MESVAEEIVWEILLKLPTRDAVRCRCVSRQWRGILTDPSFIDLHVHSAHIVAGCGAEAVVVTEIRSRHIGLEMAVLDSSSGKPMSRVTDLASCYRPTNACNGFLLIATDMKYSPVYVCNPVTGEKQNILPPPESEDVNSRRYAMGFSPSTGQYKLFRLCFRDSGGWPKTWENYMEVYTFGEEGGGSWRRHQHVFPYSMVPRVHRLPPVLVDGKLYVLMEGVENNWVPKPDRMLVIDVASEAHVTYRLPDEFTGEKTASVYAFELDGRLCVARRVANRQLVHFLVMEPPRVKLQDHKKGRSLYGRWELRYTFNIDEFGGSDGKLSSAWLDNGDKMLRYRLGESLYIYDTTKDDEWKMKKKNVGDFSWWDYQIQLPVAPSANDQRWNVYGVVNMRMDSQT